MKKILKSIFSIVLAVTMAFAITACNKKPEDGTGAPAVDAEGNTIVKIMQN